MARRDLFTEIFLPGKPAGQNQSDTLEGASLCSPVHVLRPCFSSGRLDDLRQMEDLTSTVHLSGGPNLIKSDFAKLCCSQGQRGL